MGLKKGKEYVAMSIYSGRNGRISNVCAPLGFLIVWFCLTDTIMAQPMISTNVVLVGFTLIASYAVVTVIYRLYFHPLAKFPGPLWARLTTFPSWWYSKNQDRHLWLLSLQEQYGESIPRQLSPSGLVMNLVKS